MFNDFIRNFRNVMREQVKPDNTGNITAPTIAGGANVRYTDDAKSLRTGERITVMKEKDGKRLKQVRPGITQSRFLGNSLGDVFSSDYFSNHETSDKFEPLRVSLFDTNRTDTIDIPKIGDVTFKYDSDGAISEIGLDSDVVTADGRSDVYTKGAKIKGAGKISRFLRDLGIAGDDSRYEVRDRDSSRSYNVGWEKDSDLRAPTEIFGSKGFFSNAGPNNRHTSTNSDYVNHAGKRGSDWVDYWRQLREAQERSGNFKSGLRK